MHNLTTLTVQDAYRQTLDRVITQPDHLCSPRGEQTRELIDVTIRHTLPETDAGVIRGRTNMDYLKNELAWYLSGSNKVARISETAKLWDRIKNDDGTANSAYGHTVFTRGQWDQVRDLLLTDHESRQAVITFHNPSWFLPGSKDVPCTLSGTFRARGDRLDFITVMRSQDLWFGVPYDAPFFMFLQRLMALELDLRPGDWVHHVHSLHLYGRNYEAAVELRDDLYNRMNEPKPTWPYKDFEILADTDLPMDQRLQGFLPKWLDLASWCRTEA